MNYMLDINIIAYAINKRPERALRRLMEHSPEELCISAITLAELEYGAANSSRPERNRLALLSFLSRIQVIPFDAQSARAYGDIRFALKKAGRMVGANDLLIAAHAKSLGMTLVTNNTREFERVEGLLLENWT